MNQSTTKVKSKLKIFKRKILEYVRISRFSAWMVATVFFLLGLWYSSETIPLIYSIVVILALGGTMSVTSWINFLYDRELDTFAGEDTSFFEFISPKEMIVSSSIVSIISLVVLLYLGIQLFVIGTLIVIVGILYSLPNIGFKINPPLDCIANALEFGVLPLLLGILSFESKKSIEILYILPIIAGLIVVSYYLFINILDIETDEKFGIKTSSTLLGASRSIIAGVLFFFISLFLSLIFFSFSVITISLFLSSPIILFLLLKNDQESIMIFLSILSFIWPEVSLFSLFLLSKSLLPLFISTVIMLSFLYFIYVYCKIK